MARPLRVLFPGALYHVTARGNNRARVFRSSEDWESFLDVLAGVVDRYGWLCHSYCVLGNHYHLLIETPQPNLPVGMRQLNGMFTQRYNRRTGRCGHLFQARYKAVLVEAESHLLEVVKYIARNPVRARLCSDPAGWTWSSYPAMLGLVPRPAFLTDSWILRHFAPDRARAREALRHFVADGDAGALRLRAGVYAATDAFLKDVLRDVGPLEEVPRRQWQPVRPSLAEIFQTTQRPVAAAYRQYGYTLRDIACHLECHYATVSRRLRREEDA